MTYTLKKLCLKTDAELAELVDNGLIHTVCENDDLPTLRYLVEERRLPLDRGYDEYMPIHHAAEYGSIEMIDFLLAHGAEVNCLFNEDAWHTPLILAAMEDRPDVVLHLLEKGADPNLGLSRAHVVHSMLPYPDVLRRILECGGDPDVAEIADEETPLDACVNHWASFSPEEEAALLAKGIRIDRDLTEAMDVLLEFGASSYFTEAYLNNQRQPDTPAGLKLQGLVEKARREERPSVGLYLALLNRSCTKENFLAELRRYEAQGADLTDPCPWKRGASLLWHAVRFGDTQALRYLLLQGCSWDEGEDYFSAACRSGNKLMVTLLLKAGLEPLHPGNLWDDLYGYETMAPDMVWLPFELGWTPEPQHSGCTVLHALAYQKEYAETVELFSAYVETLNIDPNAADRSGRTPRDIATEQNFTALVDYLDNRLNA